MIAIDDQKKEITMATAAQIRHFRHQKGFSQEELALRANLNPAYLGQVERGEKCPTIDTLYKTANALGISLSELFQFEPSPDQTEAALERMKVLISRVPTEKNEQFLNVIENIIGLI